MEKGAEYTSYAMHSSGKHEISHERINLNKMTYFKIRNLDIKGKTRRKSLSILHVVCKQQCPNDRQLVDEKSPYST